MDNELIKNIFNESASGLREIGYINENTMNAVRLRIVLDILEKYPNGKLLDAGCGGGGPLLQFLKLGWDASGVDFSKNMVFEAKNYLRDNKYENILIHETSISDLSKFDNSTFDIVASLGVLYYLKDDKNAYAEFNRVLKPNGILICSHHNELFDLFSYNKYTIKFIKNNMLPLLNISKHKINDILEEINDLFRDSGMPEEHKSTQESNRFNYTNSENPLLFNQKLKEFGFEIINEPYYFGLHLLPPYLYHKFKEIKDTSEKIQYDLRSNWIGLFAATNFLVEAKKTR
jgi:SAM-dependent methyltransferase